MATKEIHEEIQKWKDIDNLIAWKEFQYSHTFNQVFWAGGIAIAILIFIGNLSQGENANWLTWTYIVVIILLSLAIIYLVIKINQGSKFADENIEYFYRKKDKQKI